MGHDDHDHFGPGDHGHTHEHWAHPGRFSEREPMQPRDFAAYCAAIATTGIWSQAA